MPRTDQLLTHQWQIPGLLVFLTVSEIISTCHGDVGTAAQYNPPYVPTECYGNDPSQFPSSNLFGAAGEGIWDNGAACGRQYLVRCISASEANTCFPGQMIQIRILDYAPVSVSRPTVDGATLVLSNTAFGAIANSSAESVNVEFRQV
ncbi:EG45-like domain containing protein [Punica granatum]|uniref:EG45-like domain containing protein n=2 Tax=Punica granatum TaxID=22663 RepID=A0A6P8CH81_PUNGR|nr:EG45-like domain containing protein [Punica granatum]